MIGFKEVELKLWRSCSGFIFAGLAYAAKSRMKSVTFKVTRNGRDYLNTMWVPANHSEEARGTSAWGIVIAGGVLLAMATFFCLLLLAR
jgi:hypothetical protein